MTADYITSTTAPTWENKYEISTGYMGVDVSKILTGRAMAAGDFSFQIELKAGSAVPAAAELAATDASFANETARAAGVKETMSGKLSGLVFNQDDVGKTFTYVVSEVIPTEDKKLSGVTYDDSRYEVAISVANTDGNLTTTTAVTKITKNEDGTETSAVITPPAEGQKYELSFENSYEASEGKIDLFVQKNFTGRPGNEWLTTDSFKFKLELTAAEGTDVTRADVVLPAPSEGTENIITISGTDTTKVKSFGEIKFKKAGTYRFKISEIIPTEGSTERIAAVTYSNNPEKEVVVTVSDDGKGVLQASVNTGTTTSFTNRYVPTETTYSLPVTKTIEGWKPGDTFTFEISASEGTPMPKDENGDEQSSITIGKGNGDTNTGTFGPITFVQGGEYTYTIKEQTGNNIAIDYSNAEYEVTIKVNDDGNGTLSISETNGVTINRIKDDGLPVAPDPETPDPGNPDQETPDDTTLDIVSGLNILKAFAEDELGDLLDDETAPTAAGDTVLFTNQYNGESVAYEYAGFKFYKALEGRELKAGDFQFIVKDSIGQQVGTLISNGEPGENKEAEMTALDGLQIKKSDLGKDLVYTIKEVVPTGALDNITYDKSEYEVTITVSADGQATTSIVQTVDADGTPIVKENQTAINRILFENSYEPPIASIDGKKVLRHKETGEEQQLKGNEFEFNLIEIDGGEEKLVGTVKNDAKGEFIFALEYTEAGTHLYKVTEVKGTDSTITYDTTVFYVKVEVTADGSGKLRATVNYLGTNPDGPDTEEPPTEGEAPGENGAGQPDGDESTEAPDGSGSNQDDSNPVDGDQSINNPDTDSESDENESDQKEDLITTILKAFGLTEVYAEDEPAAGQPDDPTEIIFTNYYTPKDPPPIDPPTGPDNGYLTLTAQKVLTGRDLQSGEFSFAVVDKYGKTVATGTNSADGRISFTTITFTEAGTYEYDVKEINNGLGGVTYDDTLYRVVVTVQNVGGKLTTTSVQYKNVAGETVSGLTFNNVYKAGQTGLALGGTKVLQGRELKDGEFTFILKDETGKTYKAVNTKDGEFFFENLTFDEAGTFKYTLYEVKGKNKEITYDENQYQITVTVTDDLNGNLNAEYIIEQNGEKADAVTFVNTYEKAPEKPEPTTPEKPDKSPNTGDEAPLELWVMVLIIVAACAAAIIVWNRRQEK